MYRKIKKLVIVCFLAAAAIAFGGLTAVPAASAAGTPAIPGHVFVQYGHYTGISLEGQVYTDILPGSASGDKAIVSYRVNNGSFHAVQAIEAGAVNGNQKAWKFNIDLSALGNSSPLRIDFQAFYTVGSDSYVDNNNGSYYTVGNSAAQLPMWNLVQSGVKISSKEFYKKTYPDVGYSLNASVVTKNIGSPQKVQLIYSTNNWLTQKAVDPYDTKSLPNSGNKVTQWQFHADVNDHVVQFKAVFTTVVYFLGSPIALTYTDDNLGKGYTMFVP